MPFDSPEFRAGGEVPTGVFFFPGNKSLMFVKRFIVEWADGDGRQFALAGDGDFAADLGAAVEKVNASNPEFISFIDLWPGIKPCPVRVYGLAIRTVREFKKDDLWRHWSNVFDDVDFDLPDVFELFSLNRSGVRF